MSAIIRGSAQNAWDHAAEIINKGVDYRMEQFFSLKYFAWEQAGQIGDELVFDTVVIPGSEGATRPAFQTISDEVNMKGRQFKIGWTGKEKEVSVEKMNQILKVGAQSAILNALADEVMVPMEKLAWQGAALATEGMLVQGFKTNGAGTIDDPKFLDAGSTAGNWDVAGAAAKDLGYLHDTIAIQGFNDIGLFFPITALPAFNQPIPTASAMYGNGTIMDLAKNIFEGGVHPVCQDLAATPLSCMTGAAEPATDFQIYAASMSGCALKYTAQPAFEAVPFDVKKNVGTYRYQGRFCPATVVKKIGAYYYKPVAEIDTIGWKT
jgi:hypothetical protein